MPNQKTSLTPHYGKQIWSPRYWNNKNEIRTQVPQTAPIPKYSKSCIAQPLDSLYTRVRLSLIWNMELNTLDYFLYIHAYDFGNLGPNFPNVPNTLKQVQLHSWDVLYTWARTHLMWNKELNTLGLFLCYPTYDLVCLGPIFPHCHNVPISLTLE